MIKKWFLLVLSGSAKNNWHNINNKYSYQRQKIPCSLCRRVLHFTIFFLLSISNFHLSINSSTQPLIYSSTVYAFDSGFPKLVWEKEYPFELDHIEMTDESGDVILSHRESEQIILIDSQGYERLHLGPKLNGLLGNVSVSSDGSKIMYRNADNNPPRNTEVTELRTYFITRKGTTIWKKDINGGVILAPTGDWYLVSYFGNLKAYDISGKLLWEKGIPKLDLFPWEIEGVSEFSLDNNYVITGTDIGCSGSTEDEARTIYTYNRQGVLAWEGNFKSDHFGYVGKSEIVRGGYIVWNYKDYHKIYDYLGTIVTEIPIGVQKAFISPDGKSVMFQYDTSFQILNLPDKNLKFREKINFLEAKLSNEGKYLVGLRKPTNEMQENIVIYDVQNKSMWKTKIGGDISEKLSNKLLTGSRCDQENFSTFTIFKSNGKYLLIIKEGRQHLYFYQLY